MHEDDSAGLPLWCRPTQPAPLVPALMCRVGPPRGLDVAPSLSPLAGVLQCLWGGSNSLDALVVSFMPAAVPDHRVLNWIEAPIAMCGFPEPALASLLTLAHWEVQPPPPAVLLAHLRVDELHVAHGLAQSDAGIARLYTVLARRDTSAWKVFLSLASGAGKGDELMHLYEDDGRAGTVFGAMVFGGSE